MNKTHRSIWNETLGTFVAAPEIAQARGKKSSSAVVAVAAAASMAGGALPAVGGVSGLTAVAVASSLAFVSEGVMAQTDLSIHYGYPIFVIETGS